MKPYRRFLLVITLLVVGLSLATSGQRRSLAQPAAPPVMPPAYDYDAATPGVQGPTSPLVAAADLRSLRTHQLVFGVLVPLAELQVLMPAGFEAVPSAAGASTAMISITLVYHQRVEVAGGGLVGPSSGVLIAATVQNQALSRQESLFFTGVFSDQATIDAHNNVLGPGSFRLGEVEVEIQERSGLLGLTFDVTDPSSGLRLRASAVGPAAMQNHARFDPQPGAFRFLNAGGRAGPASRAASQADLQAVPAATADLKFKASGDKLALPGGSLSISGLGPNVGFNRWSEIITKLE